MADSKQKLISLRSADRNSGTIDNFTCDINNLNNVHWLQIQDMFIMLSHYQINANNRRITFEEGGPDLFADLDLGNYSRSEIEAQVKAKLDTAGALTYTVAINSNSNKLTISATGTFGLKWSLNVALAKTFGFNATDLTGTTTYTAQGIINLNRIFSSFNVYSNQLTRHHGSVHGSDKRGSMLFRALNASFPPLSHFKYSHDDHSNYLIKYSDSERLKYIDIRITDLDNNAIDFNGADEVIINFIAYIR